MAIQVYFNDDNKRLGRREWIDTGISISGSGYTWLAFMLYMERKYLPSLPEPFPLEEATPSYHSRFAVSSIYGKKDAQNPLQEVWDLQLSPDIEDYERITMCSMMDRTFFIMEDADEVFAAWKLAGKALGGKSETVFDLLVHRIQKFTDRTDDIGAFAINWTSVNNFIITYGPDDSKFYDCIQDYRSIMRSIYD